MSRRARSSRFTAWAVVLLLVLRAAVPLFAVTAAQARGVAVGEVCNLYGVTLPSASHAGHGHGHGEHLHGEHPASGDHGSQGDVTHAGDHCALTALASLAVGDGATSFALATREAAHRTALPAGAAVHDPVASWAARLWHAPPRLG